MFGVGGGRFECFRGETGVGVMMGRAWLVADSGGGGDVEVGQSWGQRWGWSSIIIKNGEKGGLGCGVGLEGVVEWALSWWAEGVIRSWIWFGFVGFNLVKGPVGIRVAHKDHF